jgi:hypothetical protein
VVDGGPRRRKMLTRSPVSARIELLLKKKGQSMPLHVTEEVRGNVLEVHVTGNLSTPINADDLMSAWLSRRLSIRYPVLAEGILEAARRAVVTPRSIAVRRIRGHRASWTCWFCGNGTDYLAGAPNLSAAKKSYENEIPDTRTNISPFKKKDLPFRRKSS